MIVTKEGSKLIFDNEGSILEYDFKDKSYVKNGRVNKKPQSYFRGLTMRDFADGCDEKYKIFIEKVMRAEKNCYNIGTILERIPNYKNLESWIMAGFYNAPTHADYHISKINKDVIKFIKKFDTYISEGFLRNANNYLNILNYCIEENFEKDIINEIIEIVKYDDELRTLIELNYDSVALVRYLVNIHNFEAFRLSKAIEDLKDYAVMSKSLNRNCKFEKYPRYLKTTHDVIVRNYNNYKIAHNEELFKNMLNKELEYEHRNYNYKIILPKETQCLKEEGINLSHCVGSYINSIINGRRQVLFLRDKNRLDESLITLDINGGMIKQAEGFMRRKPNANEKAFLEKYAKDKNLKIQKGVI